MPHRPAFYLCLLLLSLAAACTSHSPGHLIAASNPLIWADVPDPAVIRVGETYYMTSTTMHMNPGIPIMKSTDLVNWELVGYVYETLTDDSKALSLTDGEDAYGRGSWASSLRFHNGRYYVSTFSNTTKKTYVFSTDDIEHGPWQRATIDRLLHDSSLVFDDGRAFFIYGNNDIFLLELTPDAGAIKPGAEPVVIIPKASSIAGQEFWVPSEGAQVRKINGRYYISLISWPKDGIRTQLVYRADTLTGPYEGRIVLADRGIAQGGLIDTPTGNWYAFLFQDRGALGRIPYLVPVRWEQGWPVHGHNGKVPDMLSIKVPQQTVGNLMGNDDFAYAPDEPLHLAWQWNHNPSAEGWSLTARPGFLRLINTRTDKSFVATRNTLTQRSFGPVSSASTLLSGEAMQPGDIAGLGALQANYGFIGLQKSDAGLAIIMSQGNKDAMQVLARVPVAQASVHLKISMDFRSGTDTAYFYYSLDGEQWQALGEPLKMRYTLPHFMGYRYALFNFATQTTGGYADFDSFKITASDSLLPR